MALAPITVYLSVIAVFSDPDLYAFARAFTDDTGVITIAPRTFWVSIMGQSFPYPPNNLGLDPNTIVFTAPANPPGNTVTLVESTPGSFIADDTVDQFGPFVNTPPAGIPKGPDVFYRWSIHVIQGVAGNQIPHLTPTAIAQRRWIGSPEWTSLAEGGTGLNNQQITRDSSRTLDGHGLPIRGQNNTTWIRTVAQYRAGLTPKTSWERFYVRFRNLPTSQDIGFWKCEGTPSPNAGFGLKFKTNGTVEGVNVNSVSTQFSAGTVWTPTLNTWYLVDVFLRIDTGGGTHGSITIYLNHVFTFSFTNSAGVGLNENSSHLQSKLGKWVGTDNDCEIDLDDWICADLPGNVDTSSLNFVDTNFSLDWLVGSHVRRFYSLSKIGASWVGDFAEMNSGVSPLTVLTGTLTSSTSAAQLEGLTDVPLITGWDTPDAVIGAVAAIVGMTSRNAGGTDGKLGYRLAGAAAVLTTIDQQVADTANTVAYLPTGMVIPNEVSPFSVVHEKSADANLDTVSAMGAIIEYIGSWGNEDDPDNIVPSGRLSFTHNAPYLNSAYGDVMSAPIAVVAVIGATFVGNGTVTTLTFAFPVNFFHSRPTAGGNGGIFWHSAMMGAHLGGRDRVIPNMRAYYDATSGLFCIDLWGNNVDVSQSGVTYQYIAFCDPGMRFSVNGSYSHDSTVATQRTNPLITNSFTPDCGFAWDDILNSISNTNGGYFKGTANGINDGCAVQGGIGVISNFGSFANNVFNSRQQTNRGNSQMAYNLWRTTDSCGFIMCQVAGYTGNATNPRNIPLTPASGGRFPIFVFVASDDGGAAFYRDPSHAGLNSQNAGSSSLDTNAIRAVAVDQITVGSTLNANGVKYSVFVILGDSAGMNNGTFTIPYCDGNGPYTPPASPPDAYASGDGGIIVGDVPGGSTALTLLKDISGIYTLIPGQRHDTLYDRQTGQPSIDVAIPDPSFGTGYIGG